MGVLTRLEEPKRAGLTLLQKLKLYNGRSLPGFTEDSVLELQARSQAGRHDRITARYIQDKLSNALVSDQSRDVYQSVCVAARIENGLRHHSLITNEEQRKRYRELLAVARARIRRDGQERNSTRDHGG